jgi:hypothetical protein
MPPPQFDNRGEQLRKLLVVVALLASLATASAAHAIAYGTPTARRTRTSVA